MDRPRSRARNRYRSFSAEDIASFDGLEQIAAWNEHALEGLADDIGSRNGHNRLQVVIAGHADDTALSDRQESFRSNFEISQARTHQVWLEILERLEFREVGWPENIDWYPVAFSSQGPFMDPELTAHAETTGRLLVEVAVIPSPEPIPVPPKAAPLGRPLELLDYLYFTVYTITTTGYGDIVPVSAYAKLTTALANLSEVLFMVIFFNVLVAFLRPSSSCGRESPS